MYFVLICPYLVLLDAASVASKTSGNRALRQVAVSNEASNSVSRTEQSRIHIDLDTWYARKDKVLMDAGVLTSSNKQDVSENGLQEGGARGSERGEMRAVYDELARDPSIKTICETGFNAGDSAMRFLAQSNATLFEFDLGEHSYSRVAANFMKENFPHRFHITWGDSRQTLPAFREAHPEVKCDLAIVDGGHSYDVAYADLANFKTMVTEKHVLFCDDTPCLKKYCIGVNKAWGKLMSEGCLVEDKVVRVSEWYGFRKGTYQNFDCSV
mmetsp:Transcript_85018/g.134304  ORF Transcript_85018/g.134304 Transcript_85018/m.134304 type:complete len:269 (+) Transcript_85018:83-889(+)